MLALALVPAMAAAQSGPENRPAVLPTRDVDVTYRSQPADAPIEQRMHFSAAMQRTRIDLPTPGLFSIMDYRTHTMSLVSVVDRKVLQTSGPAVSAQQDFIRRGQDQVAGLSCTEWEARDSVGQPAISCFTPDGVMLRARRGPQVLAVATQVVYAAQDPALFEVPASYDRVQRRTSP